MAAMPIQVLDEAVATRIAAGEVVERPASVVKELVENALDAGARTVSVETEGGGVNLIRVSDDGAGIPAAELETAFQRYATSKLSSVADLARVSTFGFRGEALPSIAAVAEVEVVTCTAGAPAGEVLRLHQGQPAGRGQRARARGTTVTVRGLFQTVPARLKFLKSNATENAHIARVVSGYALAFPGVRFSLRIDGRHVLATGGSGRLIDAAIEVYGVEVARGLMPIAAPAMPPGGITISGMISQPSLTRANRDSLSLFVNRRAISSRPLAYAVEEAYHGLLMPGRHPLAIINISLPPEEVDVNVHPTKAEVKFRDERAVFTAVQRAVRATLVAQAPVPRMEEPLATYRAVPPAARPLWGTGREQHPPPAGPPAGTPSPPLPALRVLGQVASTYIVAEGPDGLYLVDQHAAHERVLYEKYRRQLAAHRVEVQPLLKPTPFEVSPAGAELLRANLATLAEAGFSLEPFGEHSYLVRTIPALLSGGDWAAAVREVLDGGPAGTEDWTERMAVSLACHAAVRAGKTLNLAEMRHLLRELEQASLPRTCPHGRPTVLRIGNDHLEREFGRRG